MLIQSGIIRSLFFMKHAKILQHGYLEMAKDIIGSSGD
jgi:hypothetical protein